eukprot:PhM_4_TR9250/c0_g1_i1/m.76933/K13100/CWC22; pre-mRNA-splicing factor CWC22
MEVQSPTKRTRADSDETPFVDAAPTTSSAPTSSPTVEKLAPKLYRPPTALRAAAAKNKNSDPAAIPIQRASWLQLGKRIRGCLNKANANNIKDVILEIMRLDLKRGRGLYCREVMASVQHSTAVAEVLSAMTGFVNAYRPYVGELLARRLISAFRKAHQRNDKPAFLATCTLIAYLTIYNVLDDLLLFEVIMMLVQVPTDDSVETAAGILKQTFRYLSRSSPCSFQAILERCRQILQSGTLGLRATTILNDMFKFIQDNVGVEADVIPEELDLVDAEMQQPHEISLDDVDSVDVEEKLDYFRADPDYLANQDAYRAEVLEMLGVDVFAADSAGDDGDAGPPQDDDNMPPPESDDEGEEPQRQSAAPTAPTSTTAVRNSVLTGDEEIAFRKRMALIIQGSMNPEECAHKLIKASQLGQEANIAGLLLEACVNQKTYSRFYGNLANKLCASGAAYARAFEDEFVRYYLEADEMLQKTLRHATNVFAHLLYTDGISWKVMRNVRITADDTTTARRVFLRYLFEEMATLFGVPEMLNTMMDPSIRVHLDGLFPVDDAANARYALQFFASIGLAELTEDLQRKYHILQKRALGALKGGE